MKRILASILLVLTLALLTGCGNARTQSGVFINAAGNATRNHIDKKYDKFNGKITQKVTLKDKESCAVTIQMTTVSGSFKLSIVDKTGNIVYEGNEKAPEDQFTVNVTETESFEIVLEAKDHQGSYNISWEIS